MKVSRRFKFIVITILSAAFFRLVPHMPNFTPIAAIALFGGAYLSKKYIAYLIPLTALFLTDMIIGFHSTMWAVYLGFAITVYIGTKLSANSKPLPVIGASLLSSTIFYIITNFGSWLAFYPHNIQGLMDCYILAIPFFNNGIVGDLFYSTILFGGFHFIKVKFPKLLLQ
jgi:hypothetical protein